MEEQITIIGTILLGAFYALGYVLDQRAKKSSKTSASERLDTEQTEFLSTLSSTASQSTSLNMLLWQRVTDLEVAQETNDKEIAWLKQEIVRKDTLISDLQNIVGEADLQES